MIRAARSLVIPIAALLIWEGAERTAFSPTDTTSRPSDIVRAAAGAIADGSLAQATLETLGTAAAGLAIAACLGVLIGVSLGLSRIARGIAGPTVELLRPIPAVALIPLGLLVFGFGMRMEIMTVAFACFWPVLLLTIAAVRSIEPRLLEVAGALELGRATTGQKIIIPSVFPRLFVGLRLAASISLVVAVTVEIAVNPQGIGYRLMLAQQNLRPDLAYALLLWIGCLGWALNVGLGAIEQKFFGRFLPTTWGRLA